MKYLLDTHIWLWWTTGATKIDSQLKHMLNSPENDVYFSVASAWEISIKYRLGKLPLKIPPEELIAKELHKQQILRLPIKLEHATLTSSLPLHHHDPFDRLLICQSIYENCTFVTADTAIREYDLPLYFVRSI